VVFARPLADACGRERPRSIRKTGPEQNLI
jgi:hypothetical protein